MTQIAVISQSTVIAPQDLALIVDAWDRQSKEFCAAWGIPYVPVLFYATPPADYVASGEVRLLTIQDQLDVPQAEGYHTDALGDIFARVLAFNNADAGSHEVCEENLDPTADAWRKMLDGREVAFESCDPVEGDSYIVTATIGDVSRAVPVSNYVLPSWFDPNGKAPFDRMGKLTAPFTMTPGGYLVVRDANGDVEDVFAERFQQPRIVLHQNADDQARARILTKLARPDSRLMRRLRAAR